MENLPENVLAVLILNLPSEDVDELRRSNWKIRNIVSHIEQNNYYWKMKFLEILKIELTDNFDSKDLKMLFKAIIEANPKNLILADRADLFKFYLKYTNGTFLHHQDNLVRLDAINILRSFKIALEDLSSFTKRVLYKIAVLSSLKAETEQYLKSVFQYDNDELIKALGSYGSFVARDEQKKVLILGSSMEKIIRTYYSILNSDDDFLDKIVFRMKYQGSNPEVFREIDFLSEHLPNLSDKLIEIIAFSVAVDLEVGKYLVEKFKIRKIEFVESY